MTERNDPFDTVSRELLAMMVDAGRPMTMREVTDCGLMEAGRAAMQLSVARVAGFVRTVPGSCGPEPRYMPTALGLAIARRTRAFAAAKADRRRLLS